MAQSGERRMLFDTTSGRRRNVIRVVYAVLALLMGASLFLTVGPFSISELFGNGSTSDASEIFHEQSESIEGKLAKDPTNEALLLALTRARISAGNAQVEVNPRTNAQEVPTEARNDFDEARRAWNRYLEQAGDEVSFAAAQLVAFTLFRLAESSTSINDATSNVAEAAKAQKIAAEHRPSVGSLTTLAIYQYFNGEYAAGDKTMKRATTDASTKAEAKSIEKQLAQYRKQSKPFDQQREQLAQAQKQTGGRQLQVPAFEGLGGGAAPPSE